MTLVLPLRSGKTVDVDVPPEVLGINVPLAVIRRPSRESRSLGASITQLARALERSGFRYW
jgi:hypothetical protein